MSLVLLKLEAAVAAEKEARRIAFVNKVAAGSGAAKSASDEEADSEEEEEEVEVDLLALIDGDN